MFTDVYRYAETRRNTVLLLLICSCLCSRIYPVKGKNKGKLLEEMNDPNSEDTSKRAYQLQNIEKYQMSEDGSRSPASPLMLTSGIKNVSDLFACVKLHKPAERKAPKALSS